MFAQSMEETFRVNSWKRDSKFFPMTPVGTHSVNLQEMFEKVMNDDKESLRNLLNSSGSSPSAADLDFVRNIANYSRDKLSRERKILGGELDMLQRSVESEVFISDRAVEPSIDSIDVTVRHEARAIHDQLKMLTLTLPSETSTMQTFREEKQRVRFLLSKLESLSEFLEIPQLMEQCVGAKQFGEALSLYDYFNRITKKAALTENNLVRTIRSQLDTIRVFLLADVERALSSQNLKVQEVNNLLLIYRLMFPRENLRAKFLEFRFKYYFQRKEKTVMTAASPAKSAKEFIELFRVQLTDIVNQFKTLFPSDSDNSVELSQFILSEIDDFFKMFEESTRSIPSDQVFAQLADMYKILLFIKPFQLNAKVNYIVHSVLLQRIELACADAVEVLKRETAMYNWKPFLSLIPDQCDPYHVIQLTRNKPTAVLYNDVTNILNDLRQFPMWSLREIVVELLDQTLVQSLETLSSGAQRKELQFMRNGFCTIIVPVTEKNLGSIYGFLPTFHSVRSHPKFLHSDGDTNSETRIQRSISIREPHAPAD